MFQWWGAWRLEAFHCTQIIFRSVFRPMACRYVSFFLSAIETCFTTLHKRSYYENNLIGYLKFLKYLHVKYWTLAKTILLSVTLNSTLVYHFLVKWKHCTLHKTLQHVSNGRTNVDFVDSALCVITVDMFWNYYLFYIPYVVLAVTFEYSD